MAAPFAVIGIAAVVVAKAFTSLWLLSIATNPLSNRTRTRLLDNFVQMLDRLAELNLSPGEEKLKSLRDDVALLRHNADPGWDTSREMAAASRITSFMGWAHARGAIVGTWDLIYNSASGVADAANNKINSLFSKMAQPNDDEGNIR